ncbi:DNA gyrase subunit B [Enhygromyxa salina]|uniref:DNA topoisomerase (ATP-hydrolyzing) n=2 Tax=Enhygromyxa salina TaxID=215803 RepID=A0A2S9YJU7_9BACT|nr:DNA gyrase subunit B [Enhygromyxa salina]
MQWCDYAHHRAAPEVTSFCNLMRTHDGGSHVKGFMRGTRDVLRRTFEVADQDELDELTRGLCAVVSVNLIDPAYGAPTKDLLKNPEAHTLVRRAVIDGLSEALAAQPALFEALTKRLADNADESPD